MRILSLLLGAMTCFLFSISCVQKNAIRALNSDKFSIGDAPTLRVFSLLGFGVMAIGLAQIVAGSQMGLVESESPGSKALAKLGNISDKVHELLKLRAEAT